MRIVGIILSVISYIFGFLFVWAAFGTPFDGSSLTIGLIMIAVASVIMLIVTRKGKAEKAAANVTSKVDLGGKTSVNKLVCEKCGGPLGKDDITLVAGVPTVTCPYCGVSYQITEEPKW